MQVARDAEEHKVKHATTLTRTRASERGFTLIELVVVIVILGVLAAVAVPLFQNMGTSARIASLKTLAGTLQSTAINVRVMCKTNPQCDYDSIGQYVVIGGRTARLNYGWLDAGDNLYTDEIDAWMDYSGFTPVLAPSGLNTLFTLDGAPDPTNCAVRYEDAFGHGPAVGIVIATLTTGC